jgi:hypothetical protein
MERIESKVDSLEERVESIDRKLDRLLLEVTGTDITDGMGKRLGKVEKTIQDDLIPWKHFVQKAVIILGTLTSLVAFAKYIL